MSDVIDRQRCSLKVWLSLHDGQEWEVIRGLLSFVRWCSGRSEGSATWAMWWSTTSTSWTVPLHCSQISRAHPSSTLAPTASASLRTTCVTLSTTVGTTLTRTPTSAVRRPPVSDRWWQQKDSFIDNCRTWIDFRFYIAVFQRALVGAAILSLTSAPGVSADRTTLTGWSKRAARRQLAPGRRLTTRLGTPQDTTSTLRALSHILLETSPVYQDRCWAAEALSARWEQRAESRCESENAGAELQVREQ